MIAFRFWYNRGAGSWSKWINGSMEEAREEMNRSVGRVGTSFRRLVYEFKEVNDLSECPE